MKILKKPDTNWSLRHTCTNCTAELEVEKGDVKYHSYPGDQRDPGYDTWTATCPVCSALIDVPVSKIPKAVQVEIKRGLASSGLSYGGPFDR